MKHMTTHAALDVTAMHASALTHRFANGRGVDSLSFQVPRGGVYGFLGPNGAGKTTTIRLMLGLLAPDHGTVRVFDLDPVRQGEAVRARTGVLLDEPGLYGQLSAQENLVFSGRMFRMTAADIKARSEQLLRELQLFDRRHEPVRTWSRGMRQQLGIARALLHRPDLLVLDEPTAGLDVIVASAIRRWIAELARDEGTTVFLTTHNMTEATELCHTVGIVRNGAIVAQGSPASLSSETGSHRLIVRGAQLNRGVALIRQLPAVRSVAMITPEELRVQMSPGESASALVAALVHAGAIVERVVDEEIALEAAFLSLMEAS